jgi:acetolactate synthase-1/2/3 large subunit
LTKKTTRLSAAAVRSQVFDAAQLALEGRPGPVHVGLPLGLSGKTATAEDLDFVPPPPPTGADPALLKQAAKLFAGARKPLLAVGLGAVHAKAQAEIQALVGKHKVPVVLTPMAKGILGEDDPAYAGVLFHALSDMVGETHQQADLVIGVGYDPVEFNYESWLPQAAPLVSFDVAPADIDRDTYTLAVDAPGDIATSLGVILDLPAAPNDWDLGAMAERRAAMFARLGPSNQGFGPKGALAVLREVLPRDGIMTCDVGAHTHLIGQLWATPAPGLQIMTNGWSTMGFGIPSAIAAKLMCPGKHVCAVVGDGGFLMTAGELATAARLNLNVVIVLFADNELALIRIKQEMKGNPVYGTPVRERGSMGGGNIFGVPVRTAHNAANFQRDLEAAFAADGPVVVEAIIDASEYDDVVLKSDRP